METMEGIKRVSRSLRCASTRTTNESYRLKDMEAHISHAKKGSVVDAVLSREIYGIDILGHLTTMRDFRDHKIKELVSAEKEDAFYVANLDSIYEMHLRWCRNLPRVQPFYAVKCNNDAAVLRMMRALDTGFDCASKVEMQRVLSLGVKPDRIIYAHTTKALSHIKYACIHGVNTLTFDSEEELLKISLCHAKAKLVLRIAVDDSASKIRLSLKFGARLESVGELLGRAAELGLEVIGVSFHVGSGCTGSLAFKQAIGDARRVFEVGKSLGLQMSLLDIGGGFSGREDCQVTFEEFSEVINGALEEFFPPDSGVQIIAEPGRYFVDSAFTLAANVIAKRVIEVDRKEHNGNSSQMRAMAPHCSAPLHQETASGDVHAKPQNGVDNSLDRIMMYYLNDGVYGSLSCLINDAAHTQVEPYLNRVVESSEQRYRSVLWGPTCDSIDKVAEMCWIPELHVGDWLLVDNMGAYSICLSTDFNGFERARIYPVVTAKTWHTLNLSAFYHLHQ
ncbi:ornithine decarboxylase-like isoform X2 [Pungitius pungitius]|uniref:ornithine decarboxylase-like isoform X2 n=2 Tax=Pungitius pungitius TaxID=134920 RepID=UPI002E0D501D